MNRAHRWRRGDGTVLSCNDLNQAVPMLLDELDDIVRLVDLVEEWLRFEEVACDLLTDWLISVSCAPGPQPVRAGRHRRARHPQREAAPHPARRHPRHRPHPPADPVSGARSPTTAAGRHPTHPPGNRHRRPAATPSHPSKGTQP